MTGQRCDRFISKALPPATRLSKRKRRHGKTGTQATINSEGWLHAKLTASSDGRRGSPAAPCRRTPRHDCLSLPVVAFDGLSGGAGRLDARPQIIQRRAEIGRRERARDATPGINRLCPPEVGRRERISRLNGVWQDTVLLERRSNQIK